jgi:hypothetical protein
MSNFEIASLVVAVLSWPVVYWFGLRSQRVAREFAANDTILERRRVFLAYMHGWLTEVQQRVPLRFPNEIPILYQNRLVDFKSAASLVKDDFTPERRQQFIDLVSAASGLNGAEAESHDGAQQIIRRIEEIIEYVESA